MTAKIWTFVSGLLAVLVLVVALTLAALTLTGCVGTSGQCVVIDTSIGADGRCTATKCIPLARLVSCDYDEGAGEVLGVIEFGEESSR